MKRRRFFIWLLLVVAGFLGAVYFWQLNKAGQAGRSAATQSTAAAGKDQSLERAIVRSASTSPMALIGLAQSTNSVVATNAFHDRLKHRLSNTTQTVGQLLHSDQAILLENALIDVSLPLNLSIPDSLRAKGDPGTYIVQSRGPTDDMFRARLRGAGAGIVSYIPNNAYLVRASAGVAQQLAGLPGIQAVLPFEPYYKLNASLLAVAVEQKSLPPDGALNLVIFSDTRDVTVDALQKLGANIVAENPTPFGPQLTVQNLTDLVSVASLPGIQRLEPFFKRIPANDLSRPRVGVSVNSTTTLNYRNLSGSNVVVNVNDSGVDGSHPDLLGRVFGPATLFDSVGHGTHVAGIIAGNGDRSLTVSNAVGSPLPPSTNQFRGKAPSAKIFSMPIDSIYSDFDLQEAAARTNAVISNNSWAYADNSYDIASANFDAAVRDSLPSATGSQPVLYVFAAGNSGSGDDGGLGGVPQSIQTPATAKNVITVGAVEQLRNITNKTVVKGTTNQPWAAMTDSDDEVASFSARGNVGLDLEGDFGRFKPDVVAPGVFVVSTRSESWDTNAYYNPTNFTSNIIQDEVVETGSQNDYSIFVPDNAVQLIIRVFQITPTNVPVPIHALDGDIPVPPANFVGYNQISLPPDRPLTTGTTWFYSIVNPTNVSIRYNIETTLVTTNDLGDYFDVLRKLNDGIAIAGAPNWYRYESGTSMAAPAVSGVLALMEDYFTNKLHVLPSPALMKAMLINGARSVNSIYDFQVQSVINYQGWGLINLTNSIPSALPTNGTPAGLLSRLAGNLSTPMLAFDQTDALATGERKSIQIRVDPSAHNQPLRVTLVWTDPPGNPAAGVKLVNNLDLVVTNTDTKEVFFGNDIQSGNNFTFPWDTNSTPNLDSINNVENVYLTQPLGTNYSITVIARNVNVNAVTADPDNVAQDYALVVSSGNGGNLQALSVVQPAALSSANIRTLTIITNDFTGASAPGAGVSGQLLLNQHVGASTPLIGTNSLPVGTNTVWGASGANGLITLGVTNQWHFYILTNTTTFTNAAFVTFLPPTLAIPRMGVTNYDNPDEATRIEADIDMYVARGNPNDPGLLVLAPAAVTAADKSLNRGGTEVITYSNALPGEVFYVGIYSEDQQAAEYGFFGGFSEQPFSETKDGIEYVRGINVPTPIPDGNPARPGVARVLAIAVQPIAVRRLVVTNTITHENFGDLLGNLSHNQKAVVLQNHSVNNGNLTQQFIYEDNDENDVPGSQHTDGPGSLRDFIGERGEGLWLLTDLDNASSHTGRVENLFIRIDPEQTDTNGIVLDIQPNSFAFASIDVPPEATNLTINVINLSASPQPLQLFVRRGDFPTLTIFDYTKTIFPPGGALSISKTDLPPLQPARYFVGVFNPNTIPQTVRLIMRLDLDANAVSTVNFTSAGAVPIADDAVSYSSIFVGATQKIARVEVGVTIAHPRVSDLAMTLISPTGKRILLFENRGGPNLSGLGSGSVTTNFFGTQTAGGFLVDTNIIGPVPITGTLVIDYDFFTVPDTMDVYYDGVDIFSSGSVSNAGTFTIPYGPGVGTSFTIVMNLGNNTNTGTLWNYTPRVISQNVSYFLFTENTNTSQLPIKFESFTGNSGTNFTLSDFESPVTAGNYPAPGTVDGWSIDTNSVRVFNDPTLANTGQQALALQFARISRSLPTQAGQPYTLSFAYRQDRPVNTNGSFEIPIVTGLGGLIDADIPATTTFGGWTVGYGNVDHIGTFWQAAAGTNSVDLNGNMVGGIYQNIQTLNGQAYDLRFAYAGNPGGPAGANYIMNVLWSGALVTNTSFVNIGHSNANLGWVYATVPVMGAGTNTLYFQSTSTNTLGAGPTLDDVSVTPRASAVMTLNGSQQVLTGTQSWQTNIISSTGTSIGTPLSFQTISSNGGLLLDSFTLTEGAAPQFAFPEETLQALVGDGAFGNWKLEVWDNRAGVPGFSPQVVSWQLRFILETNGPSAIPLFGGIPDTNSLGCGIQYFIVDVPAWAEFATNTLVSATAPVNVFFNQNIPPTGTNVSDVPLLLNSTNGIGIPILSTNSVPPLVPGARYYLGVQNLDCSTNVTFVIQVDFGKGFIRLTNMIAYAGTNSGGAYPNDYYLYSVSTNNAVRAQFEINGPTGDMTLVASRGLPPPSLFSFDYSSTNWGTNDELIVVFTNSTPVALGAGDWYLTAVNVSGGPVTYSIKASEWPVTGRPFSITNVVLTTNCFNITWTSLPGVHYYVQGVASLPTTNWINVSPTLTAGPGQYSMDYCVPLPSAFHFFRVVEGLALAAIPQPATISAAVVTNGVLLQWTGPATAQYQVQWTPSISPPAWNSFTNVVTSATGAFSFLDDGTQTGGFGPTRFYQVLQLP